MRQSISSLVRVVSLSIASSIVFLGYGVAHAQEVKWEHIIGIQESGDLVGSGTGQVTGGAPWEARDGGARVNPQTGDVRFLVRGLVLAVGSTSSSATGFDIGTPAGVTQVKGTFVCDLDGSAGGGNSVLVDTPAVTLSAQGDAKFQGNVAALPAVCSSEHDFAFLIRIVTATSVANSNADLWIAVGTVRTP